MSLSYYIGDETKEQGEKETWPRVTCVGIDGAKMWIQIPLTVKEKKNYFSCSISSSQMYLKEKDAIG